MSENILLMPFLDESESFVHGFECGKIWQLIEDGEVIENYLVHVANKDQIELMCKTFNLDNEFSIINEDWAYLTIQSIIN